MDGTMIKYTCNSCGGVYADTSADGVRYFHACPPVLNEKSEPVERSDKRDENVGKKLEGKGRSEVK